MPAFAFTRVSEGIGSPGFSQDVAISPLMGKAVFHQMSWVTRVISGCLSTLDMLKDQMAMMSACRGHISIS